MRKFTAAGIEFTVHDHGDWIELVTRDQRRGTRKIIFHGETADLDANAHINRMVQGVRGATRIVTARVLPELAELPSAYSGPLAETA